MKRLSLILFSAFALLLFSCSQTPVSVVDDYQSPSDINVIPGDEIITIEFNSANSAGDFAGFNVYFSSSDSYSSAEKLSNASGSFPSVNFRKHGHERVRIVLSNESWRPSIENGSTYYLTVRAYGTNEYSDSGTIESSDTEMHKVTPRPEGSIVLANTYPGRADDGIEQNSDVLQLFDSSTGTDALFYFTIKDSLSGKPMPYVGSGTAYIQDMGSYASLSNLIDLPEYPNGYLGIGSEVPLGSNHIYAIYTGSYYAKIWIESFTGKSSYSSNETNSLTLQWAFSPSYKL